MTRTIPNEPHAPLILTTKMCKFLNLRPSPELAESKSFCQIGSPQHLLDELFRQDNLIDIREQCKNHEDAVLPLVNDRICFHTTVYHEARIDGEEPFKDEDEWECEICNTFIKAGNWFGMTWEEITGGENMERDAPRAVNGLSAHKHAEDDRIDVFSNSDDEELDVDQSDTHGFNNSMTTSNEAIDEAADTAFPEWQPFYPEGFSHSDLKPGSPLGKRPRSPSTASIMSIAIIQHDEAATAMKTARLAKFDKPSKRRKMPYITTKPSAPAHERSPSPSTAEEIRSMIPQGGVPVAEFRRCIDYGRGYSTPYMSLIQGVANIDEVEGMLYLKDDPAYPASRTSFPEHQTSYASAISSRTTLDQSKPTAEEAHSLIPLGGIARSAFRRRIEKGWGKFQSSMAEVRKIPNLDIVADGKNVYLNGDPAYSADDPSPSDFEIATLHVPRGASWPRETHRFSVASAESGLPTLFLRPRQPAPTELDPSSAIATVDKVASIEAYQPRSSTDFVGIKTPLAALRQPESASALDSRASTDRLTIQSNDTGALSIDEGKGKSRATSPEQKLKVESSVSTHVKQEAEAHTAEPSASSQHIQTSAQPTKTALSRSHIDTEIKNAQAGLIDALNDDLLNGLARSAINIIEDPGSEEVINAIVDGSFLHAVTDATKVTATPSGAKRRYGWMEGGGNVPGTIISIEHVDPAERDQGGPASFSQPSSDAQSSSKVDSQTSASSSSTAATPNSTASSDAVPSLDQGMKATILRLRQVVAAQSDRIAKLLAEKQEGVAQEIQLRTQMAELDGVDS